MASHLSEDALRKKFEEEHGDESIAISLGLGPRKPARISMVMIARRNLPESLSKGSHDQLIDGLMKLTHVRLDRENLVEIDNLEMLGPVTNLYLQENAISVIENLECLTSLQFLTLAGNKIERVENLKIMDTLKLLDLSENRIDHLDVEELPKSLVFLNLTGNRCVESSDYRSRILAALPNLKQLDNEMLTKDEKRAAGHPVSSDDDDEDDVDEEEEDEGLENGVYRDRTDTRESVDVDDVFRLSADLIYQSRARAAHHTNQHSLHMHQIEEVRSKSQQAAAAAAAATPSPRASVASPGSRGDGGRHFTPSPASR
ncbi:uncharacterized protein [Diadema antillarum]|uniref:uncharacterized protein n=1 Tax=Diadema antillarum TaxID=105358 RepID=UPI003A85364D